MKSILRPKKKLGEILLEQSLLDEQKIDEAINLQSQVGKRLGQIIVEKGWISEQELLGALGLQFGLPTIVLRPGLYDKEAAALISKETAKRLEMLPMFRVFGELSVATADPQAIPKLDELAARTGLKIRQVLAHSNDIRKQIEEAYDNVSSLENFIEDVQEDFSLEESQGVKNFDLIDELAEGSPVINMVNSMIQRAVRDGASDIHIEPSHKVSRIRFRIDGLLYEIMTPRIEMHAAIASRLKVIAGLDIAERRLPQDGRIQVSTQGRKVDLRFSSLPGIFGEKVVLRVLDRKRSQLHIDSIGMSSDNLQTFKKLLKNSTGLILVTGPTGSGKTTTLYAAINHLKSIEKNIVTIEDPVEYQLEIINQNQVHENIGLDFASMLKHILRQDPDIIMVGEIRDRQTAEIAVQAALTGHLVLSTLHTNDSIGAITRLLDMGIEPYLLSSALIGVIAQRLVRQVCTECRTRFLPTPDLALKLKMVEGVNMHLTKGRGCQTCYDSGYKGRIGIHEILTCNSDLQVLMNASPTREDIESFTAKSDIPNLRDDGFERVRQGLTTYEEIIRTTSAV